MNEIEFRNIYKEYRLKKRTIHFLKDFFHPQYERKMALNGVSFSIPQGQIVGYIGPNGAGKSTTIKIMTGILKPTSGTCRVLGADPTQNHNQFVRQIGVVFGNRSNLIWDLPVIDSFKMMKEIYEIEDDRFNAQLELLTQNIDIQDILDVPVRQMSLGQRMRCELVVALLHSPKILFLDEPTLGLDAVSKIAMHHFIKKINVEQKLTVVLTTHDMNDINELAQRIIVIGNGSKLYDGAPSEIINRFNNLRKVTIPLISGQSDVLFQAIDQRFTECQITQKLENEITLEIPEGPQLNALLPFLTNQYQIENYTIQPLNTEEVIAHFYQQHAEAEHEKIS